MSEKKRRGSWAAALLYRLGTFALIGGILFAGYRLAEEVIRRVGEQTDAAARSASYIGTATAIAPTATATATMTFTPSATATASSTATATATSTATSTVTYTPTLPPTASMTPAPTLTPTPEPTQVAMVSVENPPAQVFATNTPRPANASEVTLPAINTPQGAAQATATQPPTMTSVPSATQPPMPTLTPPPTDAPAVSLTPRPLPTLFVFGNAPADAQAPTAIPTAVEYVDRRGYDLMNIVLLGNDEELTDDNFIRTDTMIIVSINRTTGTVSMLGLPRDLFVYIPGWTMQRLNLAYQRGVSVGWTDGGFGLLRQTILYNFGINVHYYAMVNLTGLQAMIDTVGGVEVAVDCAILNLPLIGAEVPAAATRATDEGSYLLPVGVYDMNGAEALWYARARDNAIEFDRQRRQMQLLRAIWRKARDGGLLTNAPALWNEIQPYMETNLTFEDLVGLLPIAFNLDPSGIENFNFRRLYHTTPWQPPDGVNVQLPVYDTIRPMLEDFYSPPTESQVRLEGASIRVMNGTSNADWDRVAADRLGYSGFVASAAGAADNANYSDTILIDYTGQSKGSSLQDIARILNVRPENIRVQPDPNREVDFEVILGANYTSCTEEGIITTPGV
jgi:polyisoprenyl-teichoic acid--peptidoglycan teichoic acid transferase